MSTLVLLVEASLNIHRCNFLSVSLWVSPLEFFFLYEGFGLWLKPCSLIMHIEWTERHHWLAFHVLEEGEGEGHHSPFGFIAWQLNIMGNKYQTEQDGYGVRSWAGVSPFLREAFLSASVKLCSWWYGLTWNCYCWLWMPVNKTRKSDKSGNEPHHWKPCDWPNWHISWQGASGTGQSGVEGLGRSLNMKWWGGGSINEYHAPRLCGGEWLLGNWVTGFTLRLSCTNN